MHAAFGNNTKDAVTPGVKQKNRVTKSSRFTVTRFFSQLCAGLLDNFLPDLGDHDLGHDDHGKDA